MIKNEVKFSQWMKSGLNLYVENFGLIFLSTLLATILGAVTLGICAGPAMCAVFAILLRLIDKSELRPKVTDVFAFGDYFLNALLFSLCWLVLYMVGSFILGLFGDLASLLTTLYGISLQTLLMFAPLLIVDKKKSFKEAMLLSAEIVKGNFAYFFAFALVLMMLNVLGVFIFFIGFCFVMPFVLSTVAIAYRDVTIPQLEVK